ncbi:hypothetical protein K440DRAFT_618197, partial [Wilcoxina mikolae CBS 423.85]
LLLTLTIFLLLLLQSISTELPKTLWRTTRLYQPRYIIILITNILIFHHQAQPHRIRMIIPTLKCLFKLLLKIKYKPISLLLCRWCWRRRRNLCCGRWGRWNILVFV